MMKVKLYRGICLVAALLLALPVTGQHLHPKLKSKERTPRSFVVLPPKVDAGSQQERSQSSQATEVASRLGEAVASALKTSGWEVKPTPADASAAALQSSYDTLHASILAKPSDVAKGSFALGDQAQDLAATGADADLLDVDSANARRSRSVQ